MDTASFNWAAEFERHWNLLRQEDEAMATAVAKKKRGGGSEGERGSGTCPDPLLHIKGHVEERKAKRPAINRHGVYTRPRLMHVAIRSTAKITLDLRVVFDPELQAGKQWRAGLDLRGMGFGSSSPCSRNGKPFASQVEAVQWAMQEAGRRLENQAASPGSPTEAKRIAAALADVKSSPWWPADSTNGADTRPGRVEHAASSPATRRKAAVVVPAGAAAYRDDGGEVVRVTRGLGGVWISSRGEAGHTHRVTSPKLPARKTPAEAQADLDAYAANRGWAVVEAAGNGAAIVAGPAVPIMVPPKLNANERKSLAKCERVIEGGIQTVFEVGQALLQIRDSRLYRESHDTFERYVQQRWDFTRQRAYQLIDGSRVREQLAAPTAVGAKAKKTAALPAPQNEAQVRPLLRVDEDQRPEVWRQACKRAQADGHDQPTAAIVTETVKQWITPEDELPRAAAGNAACSADKSASAPKPIPESPNPSTTDGPAEWARDCDELEQHVMRILGSYADWPRVRERLIDVLELLIERVDEL